MAGDRYSTNRAVNAVGDTIGRWSYDHRHRWARPDRPALGWADADRHLERQLPPLPHRAGRGVPAAARRRRARRAGDQGARGPAAPDGPPGRGVRRRGRGHEPVERRRDHQPGRAGRRDGRLRGHAGVRRPARGRVARDRRDLRRRTDLVALRPQRPQAGRPALRLQAGLAGPAPRGGRRLAGAARPRWSATGTSARPTTTSSTPRSSRTPPTSRRPSARPSRPSSTTGTPR